jgi:hypothetical protein
VAAPSEGDRAQTSMATAPNHAEVRRSFRRRSTSSADPSAPPSSASSENEPPRRPTLWFVPVDTVGQFIAHKAFADRLTQGLVFVHNKRPTADLLIDVLRRPDQSITCAEKRLSEIELKAFEAGLSLKRPSRGSKRAIVILDCDTKVDQLSLVLGRLAAAAGRRKGIWVRGHISDFPPSALRIFDVMFLFDMAEKDSEMLRSVIPLPPKRIQMLRDNLDPMADVRKEAVLVFTAGADHRGRRLTQIAGNPALIWLIDDDHRTGG